MLSIRKVHTRWIGYDGIKEAATTPRVICDVKRAKIHDTGGYAVLCSSPNDAWSFVCGIVLVHKDTCNGKLHALSTHLSPVDIRTVDKSAEVGCGLMKLSELSWVKCSRPTYAMLPVPMNGS
jgi:hypothetical protein